MVTLSIIGHFSLPGGREIAYKRELDLSPHECVEVIKKHVRCQSLSVIVISIDGHTLPDLLYRAKNPMGMDGYL